MKLVSMHITAVSKSPLTATDELDIFTATANFFPAFVPVNAFRLISIRKGADAALETISTDEGSE